MHRHRQVTLFTHKQMGAHTERDMVSSILVKYCLDGSWRLILSFY